MKPDYKELIEQFEETLIAHRELIDWISGAISKAEYEAEELEHGIKAWEPLANAKRNGMLASFRTDLENKEAVLAALRARSA